MKAHPLREHYNNLKRDGYETCKPEKATHIRIDIPGPTPQLTLPIIRNGTRAGTNCWTWNGSITSPTLRPSIKTEGVDEDGKPFVCHVWVTQGLVKFLDDTTHELRGQTVPLHDVE